LNGLHQIRLVATDAVGRTTVTDPVTLSIEGAMKFGHFNISFNDLTLPVAGIPIQITRAYDSRNTAPGDFGAGWSLELRNIRLRKNQHLGRDWEHSSTGGNLPVYCIDSANPRLVTVTFPDGRVHRFQALPNPECQALAPLIYPRMAFLPLPGTYSTLRPVLEQHGDLIPDDQLVWGASSPFSPDPNTPPAPVPGDFISWELLLDPPAGPADNILYNPDLFELTTPGGYTYLISETNGLRRLTDPNGNSLSITRDGLFHSTGLEVLFQRDHLDRITNITDTAGLSLDYEYDDAGNLTTFTDREGNAHHFTYDAQHHLLALTDARGITPLTNEYAPDGRLLGHTDALGRSITYNHDPAQHVTSVTDRTGAITTHIYDTDGNLTRSIDPLGHITDISHDDEGRRTSITDPLGHITRFT
jgi:YD repeat-containing protein